MVFHDPQRDIEAGTVTIGCIITFNPEEQFEYPLAVLGVDTNPIVGKVDSPEVSLVMAADFDAWNGMAIELQAVVEDVVKDHLETCFIAEQFWQLTANQDLARMFFEDMESRIFEGAL